MSNEASDQYLVLEDDIGHDQFLRLAEREGWTLAKTYPAEGDHDPFEEVWVDCDRTRAIHYIDDPISGTRHLRVRGADLKDLLFAIVRFLPIYPREELIEAATGELPPDEAIDVLFRIAVAYPTFDLEIEALFASYLTHPNAMVRKAAVQALGYRAWPQSIRRLGEHRMNDSNPEVRQFADRVYNEMRHVLEVPDT